MALRELGFLYLSNKVKIGSFIHGGSQERSRRAGTLNVPGIIGMAKAAELACKTMDKDSEHMAHIRDYMIDRISSEIPYAILNGDKEKTSGQYTFQLQIRGSRAASYNVRPEGNMCIGRFSVCLWFY